MTQISSRKNLLRRPAILVQAAKTCACDYRRGRTVARLVKGATPPNKQVIVEALRDEEDRLEVKRQQADGSYNARQHVQVLAALIAEQRAVTG